MRQNPRVKMRVDDRRVKDLPHIRFFRKVLVGDGCWEWTGAKKPRGYGIFQLGGRDEGTMLAPRYCWEFLRDVIPDDLCVLHTCDNPGCVRIDHLWLGTRADNNHDMIAKGRYRGCAKARPNTPADLEEARGILGP